ncbi:hypothetical protein [Rhizobium sp. SSA_523]|uniref:hypothetical protein n=1 Tax=Rhizobium sp. SSA_523 TaxID=2952477 RepID=UPI002090150E|nr:hypothetical protein [Rhizobium sp. SSA_523]MCO5733519.1 hypothetical protein [Rhizobium sp. SSA_523]WKC25934.1 hypothetical protein QTJ18_20470 [Rhizobium sp. SSA_523]
MAAIHLMSEIAGYEFGSIGCRTTRTGQSFRIRLLRAPDMRAKNRAGRRLWSCSTINWFARHPNFDPMDKVHTSFRGVGQWSPHPDAVTKTDVIFTLALFAMPVKCHVIVIRLSPFHV